MPFDQKKNIVFELGILTLQSKTLRYSTKYFYGLKGWNFCAQSVV